MNKKLLICCVAAILLLAVIVIGSFFMWSAVKTPERLVSLGEKYLSELNYEQALVQFLKVIEIDPMNPRGYTGAAEAYVGLDRTDNAIDILRQGFERTNNDTIRGMLSRLESDMAASSASSQNDIASEDEASIPLSQDIVTDAKYTLAEVSYPLDRLNVPYINFNSDGAEQANKQIYDYFREIALYEDPNPDEIGSERGPWYTDMDYCYYINGDILSIVVMQSSGGTAPPIYGVKSFNLDMNSGKLLSYDGLASYVGRDAEATFDLLTNHATQKIYGEYEGYNNNEMMQRDIAGTHAANYAWYEAKGMPWFINKDGELCGFVYLSLGILGSGNCLTCYTVDGQSISLSAGTIEFLEGLSDTVSPADLIVNVDNMRSGGVANTYNLRYEPFSKYGRDITTEVLVEINNTLQRRFNMLGISADITIKNYGLNVACSINDSLLSDIKVDNFDYGEDDNRLVYYLFELLGVSQLLTVTASPIEAHIGDSLFIIQGSDIVNCNPFTMDNNYGFAMTLTDEASEKFYNATKDLQGEIIYIYFGDELLSAPRINDPISTGELIVYPVMPLDDNDVGGIALMAKSAMLPQMPNLFDLQIASFELVD